jgi:AraC-like DNA-binding protein
MTAVDAEDRRARVAPVRSDGPDAGLGRRSAGAEILAASASYSSFHFDRIFRELTGFSAVEYQRKRRLRRAAHLLRHEPDVPIVRIAQDCGFPSNAAFAKAFKQQFAMSAKAWREGGWRDYMDQQVGRESDVSFFVAEPDNLEAILAPYCPPEPGTIAARIACATCRR